MMMQEFFFAQKAFIVEHDSLLLVQKSADDPHNPGLWEVPGGRMDFGEDVDEHLRREVHEEVGLEILPLEPFYIWQWQLDKVNDRGEPVHIQIVAVARICKPVTREVTDEHRVSDDYLSETRWVKLDDLTQYSLIPNMLPVVEAFLGRMR